MSMPPAILPALLLSLGMSCTDKGGGGDSGVPEGHGDSGSAAEDGPDLVCPGSADCPDADGALSVGAAKVPITPTCFESWQDDDGDAEWDDDEAFLDCGCDRLCPGDEGYAGPDDGEGDGVFQAVWMAGFHNRRPARGVHDDLWARAIVFDQGSTRIALVELDLVGFFRPDVLAARAKVDALGLDVDHVIVASTHGHEGPDTMGLWGPSDIQSGVDPDYIDTVTDAVASAVRSAVADLRPVDHMVAGQVDVSTYSDKGVYNVITDLRDPMVIDEQLGGAAFYDADGAVIASLAHFGEHPESIADENLDITSDFPHALRQTMESGSTWETTSRPGLGGTAIFINGAVGGMMTGLRVDVEDPDGNVWDAYTHERTAAMGTLLGEMALDAIEGGTVTTDPTLTLAVQTIRLPVENYGFQALFLTGIIERELFDYDSSQAIGPDNTPTVETELNLLSVGPIRFATIPGELFPELNIGGYDGSHTGSPDVPVIDPHNEYPPDLSAAPAGPYIKERIGGELAWVIGLGNDELGYIIPAYDFVLDDTNPWFDEAPGDHYEETNSLGSEVADIIDAELDSLLAWTRDNLWGE
ncbi:MAG: hypothetical protein D6798_02605 [Deltaproteobacteria bacterium]|nr:MAG: hypothetical protein D6798_02605 [Deltaproteobacteria bacterium]